MLATQLANFHPAFGLAKYPNYLLLGFLVTTHLVTRRLIYHVLRHITQEASKHQKGVIEIHPHRLRHTFGSEYRDKTGSDTETAAALGHAGL